MTERCEIPVWTLEGYEGRFLQWGGERWQAIEYRNYRHSFGAPEELTAFDLKVLRTTFDVPANVPDAALLQTSPTNFKRTF